MIVWINEITSFIKKKKIEHELIREITVHSNLMKIKLFTSLLKGGKYDKKKNLNICLMWLITKLAKLQINHFNMYSKKRTLHKLPTSIWIHVYMYKQTITVNEHRHYRNKQFTDNQTSVFATNIWIALYVIAGLETTKIQDGVWFNYIMVCFKKHASLKLVTSHSLWLKSP